MNRKQDRKQEIILERLKTNFGEERSPELDRVLEHLSLVWQIRPTLAESLEVSLLALVNPTELSEEDLIE